MAEEMSEGGDVELTRRTERWMLSLVGGYSAIVIVLMFAGGLRITPDVLAVALGLVAVLLGRTRLFLRDWLPFVVIFLAYELMRGIADDAGFPVHVTDVIAAERWLFGGIVPTAWLQDWLAPATGVGAAAIVGTILYMMHFAIPIATGFLLWVRDRTRYHDYLVAFILLSFAGFITFLFLPVAPPWWAAQNGFLDGANGEPILRYLKPDAFALLAETLGFPNGTELTSYVFYGVNPNAVAAFPSLHAGYPFLSFLVLRREFGRIGWLALVYTVGVWWSIVFLGDHYVVDVIGGVAYAWAAYLVAPRLSGWFAWLTARVARRADPA
jgi:membrane-associated phospholipid phosphatase